MYIFIIVLKNNLRIKKIHTILFMLSRMAHHVACVQRCGALQIWHTLSDPKSVAPMLSICFHVFQRSPEGKMILSRFVISILRLANLTLNFRSKFCISICNLHYYLLLWLHESCQRVQHWFQCNHYRTAMGYVWKMNKTTQNEIR